MNLAATVGDARKKLEAEHVDAGLRQWFVDVGPGNEPGDFDALPQPVKQSWRRWYGQHLRGESLDFS